MKWSVWRLPVFIPQGFKLIAVGERCATPTDSIDRDILTLKGSNYPPQFDPFRVSRRSVDNSVGVAQRSPTAIKFNPSGIGSDRNSKLSHHRSSRTLRRSLSINIWSRWDLFSAIPTRHSVVA